MRLRAHALWCIGYSVVMTDSPRPTGFSHPPGYKNRKKFGRLCPDICGKCVLYEWALTGMFIPLREKMRKKKKFGGLCPTLLFCVFWSFLLLVIADFNSFRHLVDSSIICPPGML